MGTVHLGRLRGPLGFSRLVAIKTLRPDYAANPAARAAFLDEARLTARLRHANVASTLDVVVDGDVVYIVMEYIEGRCLADLSRSAAMSCRRIPIPMACTIIHDVLLGLDHAHEAYDEIEGRLQIVHCDVSPQNVRVGKDGLTRILDFGIARATAGTTTGVHRRPDLELRGKIPYMAPEQLQHAPFDHRVDIYACGVLLWEMLTGKRLFAGANKMAVVAKVLTDPVPHPSIEASDVPEALAQVVLCALQRDPNRRFPTARAMANALAASAPLATHADVAELVRTLSKATTPQSGVRAILPPPPPSSPSPMPNEARAAHLSRSRNARYAYAKHDPYGTYAKHDPYGTYAKHDGSVHRRRRKTTREKILSIRGLIVLVGIVGVILGFSHAWLMARRAEATPPASEPTSAYASQAAKNEAARLQAPKMPRPHPPKR